MACQATNHVTRVGQEGKVFPLWGRFPNLPWEAL